MSFVIIERTKNDAFPVASVIDTPEGKTYFRNIDDRHVLRKGDYQAIFIDDEVITSLQGANEPKSVVYDYAGKDYQGTYRTLFENYKAATARKMAGRMQRGVSLQRFLFTPERTYHAKPSEIFYVDMKQVSG